MRSSKVRKTSVEKQSQASGKAKAGAGETAVDWKNEGLYLKDVLDPYWSWRFVRMSR